MNNEINKREDKGNIFCTGITDYEFVYFAIKYLLGNDWYVVDPLGRKQIKMLQGYTFDEIVRVIKERIAKILEEERKWIN